MGDRAGSTGCWHVLWEPQQAMMRLGSSARPPRSRAVVLGDSGNRVQAGLRQSLSKAMLATARVGVLPTLEGALGCSPVKLTLGFY